MRYDWASLKFIALYIERIAQCRRFTWETLVAQFIEANYGAFRHPWQACFKRRACGLVKIDVQVQKGDKNTFVFLQQARQGFGDVAFNQAKPGYVPWSVEV